MSIVSRIIISDSTFKPNPLVYDQIPAKIPFPFNLSCTLCFVLSSKYQPATRETKQMVNINHA